MWLSVMTQSLIHEGLLTRPGVFVCALCSSACCDELRDWACVRRSVHEGLLGLSALGCETWAVGDVGARRSAHEGLLGLSALGCGGLALRRFALGDAGASSSFSLIQDGLETLPNEAFSSGGAAASCFGGVAVVVGATGDAAVACARR